MRYSEWTVWSLPLVAHELAHIVLSQSDFKSIHDIFDDQLKSLLVSLDPEQLHALNPGADQQIKDNYRSQAMARVENELRYYLADAFSTWTMGPAYACAAIHLRLNPAYVSTIGNPESFDHERAEVILGVLGKMGERPLVENPFPTPIYTEYVSKLRPVWDGMVARANPEGTPENHWSKEKIDSRRDCLHDITERICKKFYSISQFRSTLFTRAGYPKVARIPAATGKEPEPMQGWPVVVRWSKTWADAMNNATGAELPRIPVSKGSMVRDALNCGWKCRLENPQGVEGLTSALRTLCQEIYEKRFETNNGGPLEQGYEIGGPSV